MGSRSAEVVWASQPAQPGNTGQMAGGGAFPGGPAGHGRVPGGCEETAGVLQEEMRPWLYFSETGADGRTVDGRIGEACCLGCGEIVLARYSLEGEPFEDPPYCPE
jgi:hypothetical protein